MCSHTVEEPGPPLYRNVTGREAGEPPFRKYATYDIIAPGSFFMSSIMIVPATAVYSTRLPRRTIAPRLSCRSSAYCAVQFSGAADFDSEDEAELLFDASAAWTASGAVSQA